jgi:polyvinyl alcohol dehydrogenase (cytochrome)
MTSPSPACAKPELRFGEGSRGEAILCLLLSVLLFLASAAQAHPIDRANVSALQPAWTTTLRGPSRATPVIDGDSILVTGNDGSIYRIDRGTGEIKNQINLADTLGLPRATPTRALAVTDTAIVIGLHNTPVVAALDKKTGALLWKTKLDDDRSALITQTPAIVGDRIFIGVAGITEEALAVSAKYQCCSFRGSMVALDRATGKILWKTYSVPESFAGGGIWSGTPLYDAKRHTLFVTTGNAFHAPPEVQACLDRDRAQGKPRKDCYPPGVWYDSILALNPDTGAVKWGFRADDDDVFTGACMIHVGGFCGGGGDFDFGNGALLWHAGGRDLVGAGQKSGVFWALSPDTGKLAWKTVLGPGGPMGGIEFGSAVDKGRIYAAEGDVKQIAHDPGTYKLPSGLSINYGSFASLDAATGHIVWQVPDPAGEKYPDNGKPCASGSSPENCAGAFAKGAVVIAGGVVYGCSTAANGAMYGFDARDGRKLWEFDSGVSCDNKPVVDRDRLYWVVGPKLYAFSADPPMAQPIATAGPAGPSVHDGVYTAAQADRGKVLYGQSCSAGCHNDNLAGQDAAPSLAGADFRARWAGTSVGELFKRIRTTMPKNNPGSLADADDLAITAYILSANGFPAGGKDLPNDPAMLGGIAIEK